MLFQLGIWNVGIWEFPVKGLAVVVVEYWGFWVMGDPGGADAIGALPDMSATWDVQELFAMNSRAFHIPTNLEELESL